ncbi:MAG: tetratricopeptide repeat protein [Cyclobacteriaceae bacterium]
MQSVYFWKTWSRDYRLFWFLCSAFFIGGLIFLWYSYLPGAANVIEWEKLHEQKTVETVSHTFEAGNFEFDIPIESYLTFEFFRGSALTPNTTAFYIFLVSLIASALIILTVITTLTSRFWYFTGMGLFILFIVSLRLDVLQLFGLTGKLIPACVIGLYSLMSFYFSFIRITTPFIVRFLIFTLLTAILGFIIIFYAGVYYPFFHLAVTGYVSGLILSVVFILMVAHEIPASFVFLASQGTATGKSLRHFSIISVIYLVNLWIAYFHEAGIIHWNFLYINPYLLLSTSALLGIWGFKNREVLYENISPFYPFGAYFFMAMAIIALATCGYLLGNQNDAALKIIRDIIIFSHIGYAIIFLLYVISNFIGMLAENYPVHKVLYQPSHMPYFTFRLAGFIATLAFVFYMNWKEYLYHGLSGFYNHMGDLYSKLEQPAFAEAYYIKSKSYGFQNNRANYLLGELESRRSNFDKARMYYELANGKRPTEYSLINHANLYLNARSPFAAIGLYRKALQKENSPFIQNNLGFAYANVHKLDSAVIMFEQAREFNTTRSTAETNFLALIGQEFIPVNVDSVSKLFTQTPGVEGNALALATLHKQKIRFHHPPPQTQLTLLTATRLNNYLVHALKELDTVFIETIFQIASYPDNEPYSEALKSTLAHACYHQGNVSKAIATLAELGYLSQARQGEYNYILGLWALEQGAPELAVLHFHNAVETDYKKARYYQAIAFAEAGLQEEALHASRSLLADSDSVVREIGRQLQKVLSAPYTATASFSDLERYQFLRYRITTRDTIAFNQLTEAFTNHEYRALAYYEMGMRQLKLGRLHLAKKYLTLAATQSTSMPLRQKIKNADWLIGSASANYAISASGSDVPSAQPEKLLFEAMVSEQQGDSLKATHCFKQLATHNPFFEDGILAAARYFGKHPAHPLQVYNFLTDAIHLNRHSFRLLTAYADEAERQGFDEYAAGARKRAHELLLKK